MTKNSFSSTALKKKKLPVSTCQRGSRITINTKDWANSMNNMRNRQRETSAHHQVKVLYKISLCDGVLAQISISILIENQENNTKTACIQ
jgi:acetamidase/formamidase